VNRFNSYEFSGDNPHVVRLVAVLLIPCLLADSGLAAALHHKAKVVQNFAYRRNPSTNPIETQALQQELAASEFHAMKGSLFPELPPRLHQMSAAAWPITVLGRHPFSTRARLLSRPGELGGSAEYMSHNNNSATPDRQLHLSLVRQEFSRKPIQDFAVDLNFYYPDWVKSRMSVGYVLSRLKSDAPGSIALEELENRFEIRMAVHLLELVHSGYVIHGLSTSDMKPITAQEFTKINGKSFGVVAGVHPDPKTAWYKMSSQGRLDPPSLDFDGEPDYQLPGTLQEVPMFSQPAQRSIWVTLAPSVHRYLLLDASIPLAFWVKVVEPTLREIFEEFPVKRLAWRWLIREVYFRIGESASIIDRFNFHSKLLSQENKLYIYRSPNGPDFDVDGSKLSINQIIEEVKGGHVVHGVSHERIDGICRSAIHQGFSNASIQDENPLKKHYIVEGHRDSLLITPEPHYQLQQKMDVPLDQSKPAASALRLDPPNAPRGSPLTLFQIIRKRFIGKSFTPLDIQPLTSGGRKGDFNEERGRPLTISTIQRDLAVLVKLGILKRQGQGRSATYRLAFDTTDPRLAWDKINSILAALDEKPTKEVSDAAWVDLNHVLPNPLQGKGVGEEQKTATQDFGKVARYYFDRYGRQDEFFAEGMFWYQFIEDESRDPWLVRVKRTVQERLSYSRSFETDVIPYSRMPPGAQQSIDRAQELLDKYCPAILGRPFPLNLHEVVRLTPRATEHADPLARKIYVNLENVNNLRTFIRIIVHESFHLSGPGDDVFLRHDIHILHEAWIEFLTQVLFNIASRHGDTVNYEYQAPLYMEWVQAMKTLVFDYLLQKEFRPFIDFHNSGDIQALAKTLSVADKRLGGDSLANAPYVRCDVYIKPELEKILSLIKTNELLGVTSPSAVPAKPVESNNEAGQALVEYPILIVLAAIASSFGWFVLVHFSAAQITTGVSMILFSFAMTHIHDSKDSPPVVGTSTEDSWRHYWAQRGPLNGGHRILHYWPMAALDEFLRDYFREGQSGQPDQWKNAIERRMAARHPQDSQYWDAAQELRMPGHTVDDATMITVSAIALAEVHQFLDWALVWSRHWFPKNYDQFLDFHAPSQSPNALGENVVWMGNTPMFEAFFVVSEEDSHVHFLTRFVIEALPLHEHFVPGRILVDPFYSKDHLLVPFESLNFYSSFLPTIQGLIQSMFDRYPEEIRFALAEKPSAGRRVIKQRMDSQTGELIKLYELRHPIASAIQAKQPSFIQKSLILDSNQSRLSRNELQNSHRTSMHLPRVLYAAMVATRKRTRITVNALMGGLIERFLTDDELQEEILQNGRPVRRTYGEAKPTPVVVFAVSPDLWEKLDLWSTTDHRLIRNLGDVLRGLVERWVKDNSSLTVLPNNSKNDAGQALIEYPVLISFATAASWFGWFALAHFSTDQIAIGVSMILVSFAMMHSTDKKDILPGTTVGTINTYRFGPNESEIASLLGLLTKGQEAQIKNIVRGWKRNKDAGKRRSHAPGSRRNALGTAS